MALGHYFEFLAGVNPATKYPHNQYLFLQYFKEYCISQNLWWSLVQNWTKPSFQAWNKVRSFQVSDLFEEYVLVQLTWLYFYLARDNKRSLALVKVVGYVNYETNLCILTEFCSRLPPHISHTSTCVRTYFIGRQLLNSLVDFNERIK